MSHRSATSPLTSAEAKLRPVVIAHRGGGYPGIPGEQTPKHFEKAISLGVDMIEVDLHETSDQVIVCLHDREYAGCVIARTSYPDLREACARKGLPVPPTLQELFAIAKGRVKLDLEVKVRGFEERLLQQVRAALSPEHVILKSFDDWVVRKLKVIDPSYSVGLLLGVDQPKLGLLYRMIELFPEVRLKRCRADFVSPHYHLVRFAFVQRMRAFNYPVLVWTLNEAPLIERFLRWECGIITDHPELALSKRSKK